VSSARPGIAILPSPDASAFRGFAWCAALVLAALAGLSAVCKAGSEQLFAQSRQAMGTTFTIYLYAANEEQASEYFEAALEEIDRWPRFSSL
jgi:thiamine biosynthesis lipoprotein ApbE